MPTLSELLGHRHQAGTCAECEYDGHHIVVREIEPEVYEASVDEEFAVTPGDLIHIRASIERGIMSKAGSPVSILDTFDGWHRCDA